MALNSATRAANPVVLRIPAPALLEIKVSNNFAEAVSFTDRPSPGFGVFITPAPDPTTIALKH